ncbi:di-trans,poly-cis-decaprenylcistransferase [Candidatus Peribacteria bacterium]|nr:di-trans,poly-cis-decaprenylcistransferase [Candidatus Peribacteria bacterium]
MKQDQALHLAIIPDGNRRWARAQALHPWKGHERAIDNFRGITEWCRNDPRVSVLTVWCFSTENWKRAPEEIAKLMTMLEEYLRKERKGFLEKKTHFVHSGRRDRIPPSLAKLIAEVEEETKDQREFTLHLAVDYGGKDEILRAVSRYEEAKKRRNGDAPDLPEEDALRMYLDHPELPDIDLILRSSGEQRTSNFFLWQTTYAEWVFSEKLFPDITEKDLAEAVAELERRKRRFGA